MVGGFVPNANICGFAAAGTCKRRVSLNGGNSPTQTSTSNAYAMFSLHLFQQLAMSTSAGFA
jgi:hypothetical protein